MDVWPLDIAHFRKQECFGNQICFRPVMDDTSSCRDEHSTRIHPISLHPRSGTHRVSEIFRYFRNTSRSPKFKHRKIQSIKLLRLECLATINNCHCQIWNVFVTCLNTSVRTALTSRDNHGTRKNLFLDKSEHCFDYPISGDHTFLCQHFLY